MFAIDPEQEAYIEALEKKRLAFIEAVGLEEILRLVGYRELEGHIKRHYSLAELSLLYTEKEVRQFVVGEVSIPTDERERRCL